MKNQKLIMSSVIVAVLLNIILSLAAAPFATAHEVNPPNGAENLPLFSQIMHMLVHHSQVLVTSSLIVALIVGLSVYIACCCCSLK